MLLLLSVVGCGETSLQMEATGRHYEVYVVTSGERWNGPLGDSLRAHLASEVEFINQVEPRLSLFYIEPNSYNSVISRHRNLMLVEINERFEEPSISVAYDHNAAPQVVVSLMASNLDSLVAYVGRNGENITRVFEIAEKDRYVNYAMKYGANNIENVVKDAFGFEIAIPQGYTIRNQIEDFIWISYEKRFVSQGIIIYQYPYTSKEDMSEANIIARRNEFVQNIPGPSDGSYMTTTSIVPPETSYYQINERLWAETRGFWEVQNDYMGGPFRSYTTIDEKTNMVICIDMYLYSPKEDKRNYIRELESLIYTVKVE